MAPRSDLDSVPTILRVKRFGVRSARVAKRLLGLEDTIHVSQRVEEYRAYWRGAAERLGAEFVELAEGLWEVRLGERRTRLANYITEADDPVTIQVAGEKPYCIEAASSQGVPVAALGTYTLGQIRQARARVREHNGPVVVKPASGSGYGVGMSTNIYTQRQLDRAAVLASLFDDRYVVERMVPAESCRLLFLDGDLIHAVRRAGVRVTGDGRSTISNLLADAGLDELATDPVTHLTLRSQGLTLDSVPTGGSTVVARHLPAHQQRMTELRTAYTEAITDQVGHPLGAQVARVVRVLRCRFAGVDVLTNDPRVSLDDSGGVFLQITTTPEIHHHYQTPQDHETHPVALRVLAALLRVPRAGVELAGRTTVRVRSERPVRERGST